MLRCTIAMRTDRSRDAAWDGHPGGVACAVCRCPASAAGAHVPAGRWDAAGCAVRGLGESVGCDARLHLAASYFPQTSLQYGPPLPCVRRSQQLPAPCRAPDQRHGDRVMRGVRDAVIAQVGPAGSKTAYGGPRRAWPLTRRSKDVPVASGRSVATRSRMRSDAVHRCAAEPCSRLQAPAAPSLSAALVDRCAKCGRRPGERATDEARSAW